jgi:uncharacterized protein with von Willebrand factor type A (vWA) domain
MQISTAESIDAITAAEAVGYDDRNTLKDALRLTLAKSLDDGALFDACFEQFFRREAPPASSPPTDAAAAAVAIEAAGQAVGLGGINLFTQTGLFTRRIVDQLGQDTPDLVQQVRAHVEARLALNAPAQARALQERRLLTTRIGDIDRRDLERLRLMVRALARRLATRLARRRRRARSGQLDIGRSLRSNMAHDGIPFRLAWKRKPITRSRIFALCDVSGSVAGVSRLLLMFLHTLRDELPDTRCFAFSGTLVEVTGVMADTDPEQAINDVMQTLGYHSSNYGRSLQDFTRAALDHLDHRATVLIAGDARGNNTPARADLLRAMQQRAGRLIWLNPELPTFWGSGDSDMLLYRPFCDRILPCATLGQLDRALSEVVK